MAREAADNLVARVAELESLVARLEAKLARKDREIARKDEESIRQRERIDELERALEDAHRRHKRQSAPFSKGEPKAKPARPGRKSGEAHGRHGHRQVPDGPPDAELDAPLPVCCPHCGGEVEHLRDDEQWQVDLPEMRPTTTRFRVGVGRCRNCKRRVQGRHPDQTSDALGAAGSQIGPVLKSWAMWLHYGMGLSFGRSAQVLGHLGVKVTPAAICQSSANAACKDLVPVHNELVARANSSKSITMDETGVRHEVARIEWLHRSEGLLMVV